jgi:hypothetical protein
VISNARRNFGDSRRDDLNRLMFESFTTPLTNPRARAHETAEDRAQREAIEAETWIEQGVRYVREYMPRGRDGASAAARARCEEKADISTHPATLQYRLALTVATAICLWQTLTIHGGRACDRS